MNIHEDSGLFDDVVDAAAIWKGIRPVYIEKDYWVCKVLKNLSFFDFRTGVIFKGGTSLSKGFGLIERFSEDIDLAIVKKDGLSDGKIKKIMKQAISCMTVGLEEDMNDPRISKRGRFRKVPYKYPHRKQTTEEYGPVSENLLIEFNSFSNPHPICPQQITSYIYDFLHEEVKDENLIKQYELYPFMVYTLCPKRTLTEKIFAVGNASYQQDSIDKLRNGIRHFYDIHQLFSHSYFGSFVDSPAFWQYCQKVKDDDHRNTNFAINWNERPLASAPIFQKPKDFWSAISSAYEREFAGLVFGILPDKSDIEKSLIEISKYVVSNSMV